MHACPASASCYQGANVSILASEHICASLKYLIKLLGTVAVLSCRSDQDRCRVLAMELLCVIARLDRCWFPKPCEVVPAVHHVIEADYLAQSWAQPEHNSPGCKGPAPAIQAFMHISGCSAAHLGPWSSCASSSGSAGIGFRNQSRAFLQFSVSLRSITLLTHGHSLRITALVAKGQLRHVRLAYTSAAAVLPTWLLSLNAFAQWRWRLLLCHSLPPRSAHHNLGLQHLRAKTHMTGGRDEVALRLSRHSCTALHAWSASTTIPGCRADGHTNFVLHILPEPCSTCWSCCAGSGAEPACSCWGLVKPASPNSHCTQWCSAAQTRRTHRTSTGACCSATWHALHVAARHDKAR